jgi:hypothetical protein
MHVKQCTTAPRHYYSSSSYFARADKFLPVALDRAHPVASREYSAHQPALVWRDSNVKEVDVTVANPNPPHKEP